MILLVIATLYPFWYVLVASLSNPTAVAQRGGLMLWVEGFTLEAYRTVAQNPNVWIGYKNTIIYVVGGTVVNLFMTTLGAYGLSRRNLYGKGVIMKLIVFTMFFSGGLIPTFLLVKSLGMVDTRWAMIIPGAISTYNMIIMRTAFQGIPVSLEESARIDGANDFTIMWRIIVPLSLPVMAVMTLFYAVGHWNSFFNALVYLRRRELFPLQLILREILITQSLYEMMTNVVTDREPIGETIKYATIIVSTVPILCLYPFLQKYFVKGVLIGSLKE
ncbi:carbohydrate ABC transporter permease [Caldicoprobacter algeriensis]|nr:carbohydrate ABC transporter permease [Caldicoprobacter algeriensis]MCM8900528.1 carbohydrate ABC transporter permease [Caldicoprobacter algeriensis]